MKNEKNVDDQGLKEFQLANCVGCFYADKSATGTGRPCCTKPTQITAKGGTCQSRVGKEDDTIMEILFLPEEQARDSIGTVKCPVCNFDYVHLERPTVVESHDNYEAWVGRGDLIQIPMFCEEGHRWVLCFGFHKGQIGAYIERLPDLPSEGAWPKELRTDADVLCPRCRDTHRKSIWKV